MHATDALLDHRGVPRKVGVHDDAGVLQVEPDAPGIGREKDAAPRVFAEAVHQPAAPASLDAAVEQHVLPSPLQAAAREQVEHPDPLAEDHHLDTRLLQHVPQERRDLVWLVAHVGRPVEEVGAVAGHAHVLERAHQASLVGFREEVAPAPLGDEAGDRLAVLVVVALLLRPHRHEEPLLQPGGKLVEHLGLPPTQENRSQGLSDPVQVAIADHAAGVVFTDLMVVQEPERRPEPMRVDELDDRHQFLETVLERRPGQDDRVRRGDLLDRPCSARLPVLDALGLIEHD